MTAETSNAREPDVAMALHWIDRYAAGIDDECQIDLVADALGVTLPDGYATAPQPADARGDVRGLVALAEQWERDAAGCRRDGYIDAAVVKEDCAQSIRQTLGISAIAEALAAEGVQADEVDQRARELLEAECGKPLPLDIPVCAALSVVKAALSQQPEARGGGDGCHCGTCTCNQNMTPAVRFDLSPAQKEGAIRDHLIALGWTPPGAQQPAAVDEALDRMRHAPNRLWMADLVGQQISVDRMRGILSFALAAQHQEPKS